jgi:hypothetical protein
LRTGALMSLLALAIVCACIRPAGAVRPIDVHPLLPPSELAATLRQMGLDPMTPVSRRGPYYVLHALDPGGIELRVVADAQFGDILALVPALPPIAYTPYYIRAPRILHVPETAAGEQGSNASDGPPSGDPMRDHFLPRVLRIPDDVPK